MNQLTSMIKKGFQYHIKELNFSCPAIIVNIDKLADGLVSVQPVINNLMANGDEEEYAVIEDVPIQFPSAKGFSITFPIEEGDGCNLVFGDRDNSRYKNGLKEPHTPSSFAFCSTSDAVAYVGFNPVEESPMNPNNYRNEFNPKAVNIIANKNTDNEVVWSLNPDGTIKSIAPNGVYIETNKAVVNAQEVDLMAALVKTSNDVQIKGKSVYAFMTSHVHAGVQSGSSSTAPPTPM